MERLAGRLKWERTPRGIRVAIPRRRGAWSVLYLPLIGIWLAIASVRYWHLLETPHTPDVEFTLQMAAIGAYGFGFALFVCWLAFAFTSETIVTVDATELAIQQQVLGFESAMRRFPASEVSRLEYVEPGKRTPNGTLDGPKSSSIRFHARGATHNFAKGIGPLEASALIQQMLEIYKFPGSYYV
jgi:hypothetical protein